MYTRAKIFLVVSLFVWTVIPTSASADDVTLTGTISFGALDGSAEDHDGAANGIFTVNDGDLIIEGTVQCNDDPPLPGNAGACPIAINVSGDLVVAAGGGIFAENRQGGGEGGDISLTVGGDLILHGPSGALPGAVVSSSRLTGKDSAGDVTLAVQGNVTLEAGSTIAASTPNGASGAVEITAGGTVSLAGLVAAGPSRQVLGTKLTGRILEGGENKQTGGAILIRSTGAGIRVEGSGIIVSQGESPGSQLVLLEACGIEIRGLVASMLKQNGPSQVVLRSGEGLLIDGRDLGSPEPSPGRLGRVRADGTEGGSDGFMVDLFANGDIGVLGPAPASSALFAVSSSPGSQALRSGGAITAISLARALTASGNAFEAGTENTGNQGGIIDLKAKGDATLDGATLRAVGDSVTNSPSRKGGSISVRSYQGSLSWTFGVGDVRPTGSGAPVSRRGSITLTACSGIDTTGTQFPTVGSPVLPFPVENDGVCSPAAPSLPTGEPPLPVCNQPPVANDDAYDVAEGGTLNEAAPGVLGNDTDPDAEPLTAVLVSGPSHASSFTLNADGSFSYTHDGSETTSDTFTYKANDGSSDSNVATVTITIDPVNDAPAADDDAYEVGEGGTLNVPAPGVLEGDTDAEDDSLDAVLVTGPSHASSFTLNADGSFSYTHDGSETASDSFTYKANDGLLDSNVATVTITVNLVNDAPVADDDAYSVNEGGTLNVPAPGVLDGDIDGDGDLLTAILVSNPVHASSFTFNADGSFSYTHDSSETTTDSFTYKANDGSLDSNVATVTIMVNPVDDPPMAVSDSAMVDEDSGANAIDVLANDTDEDGGPKFVHEVTQPANGSVAITGGGSGLTYTPNANYCNTPPGTTPDTFTYTLSPGGSIAAVSVLVNCINDPPVADPDTFDFIGNTDLVVDLTALATPHALETTGTTLGVLDNDEDPVEGDAIAVTSITVGACTDSSAPLDCSDPAVGRVQMETNGRFIFTPAPGDAGASETFQYTLTDNGVPAPASTTATVTLTRFERVWYVKNDAPAGGNGTSSSPFNSITPANLSDNDGDGDLTDDLDSAGDYIFVYFGDGTTTNHSGGLVLESGQHLIGHHAGLSLNVNLNGNGAPTNLVTAAAGSRPMLDDTVVDAFEGVSARNVVPAEIVGMNLAGNINAIDWTTTAAFAGTGTFTIRDNVIRSATGDGVDMNLAGTSGVNLAFHDNILTSTGTALDIQETGTGSLTITAFHDNVVSGNTGGSGIVISNAIFDSVPGGGLNTVDGGILTIGALGNGVGGAGMALGNVQGDLHFTENLNIFADAGAGLTVSGTGAGMQFRVNSGGAPTGIVEATGGPAVDASATAFDLRLTSLRSTNSASTGVSLTNVIGTFSAEIGSSITNSTGTAFAISGGTASVTYKGTITDDVGQLVSVSGATAGTKSFEGAITDGDDGDGSGISLSSNSGATVRFSGGLLLSTGANAAFAATGGGTVEVCDENPCNGATTGGLINRVTTTTGTALNVANTTIGASHLEFRSISAGTGASGPTNGIVVNNTGSSGGLKVKGTGAAGSGGTIQRATSAGISLTNTGMISLSHMNVQDGGDDGIRGSGVNGFDLTNLSITSNGNAVGERGIDITQLTGSGSMASCTVSGSAEHNVNIANTSGTLSAFNVTNSAFTNTNMTTGDDGFLFENNGSGSMTVSITGSTFTDNKGDHFQAATSAGATGSINVTFSNNTLTTTPANDPNVIGGGVTLSPSGSADLVFTINNNNIQQAFDEAINLNLGTASTAAASMIGTISNNTIGTAGDPDSGSESGTGISVISNGAGLTTVAITGNQVHQYANPYGILVNIKEGSTSMNATVTGNTVANPGTFAINGIRIDAGATAGDSGTLCAAVTGNSVAGSGPGVDTDIRLRQRFNTTIRLPGYGGSNNDTTAVNSFVAGNNAGSDVSSAHNVGGGGGGFVGGAACPTP